MKFLLISLLLLSGCENMPTMGNGIPEDAIIMGEREEIRINAISKRTLGGTHIKRYVCLNGGMVCRQFATTAWCSCQRELRLPPTFGL